MRLKSISQANLLDWIRCDLTIGLIHLPARNTAMNPVTHSAVREADLFRRSIWTKIDDDLVRIGCHNEMLSLVRRATSGAIIDPPSYT